jgi:hypothetical protein
MVNICTCRRRIMWCGGDDVDTQKQDRRKIHHKGKGKPVMLNILVKWEAFKKCCTELGNNINVTEVFGNKSIIRVGRYMEDIVFGGEHCREIIGMVEG